jgi:Fe-S cluster assembly iron-binding protein IscA
MKEIIIRFIDFDKLLKKYNGYTEDDFYDGKSIEVFVDGKKLEHLKQFSIDFNTKDNKIDYNATFELTEWDEPDGFVKGYFKDGEG